MVYHFISEYEEIKRMSHSLLFSLSCKAQKRCERLIWFILDKYFKEAADVEK